MTKQIRWTVVLVFILTVVLVGCGGGDAVEETAVPQATAASEEAESQPETVEDEAEPEPTDPPAPTDTPEPTNTPEPTDTPIPEPTDTPEPVEEAVVEAPELDLASLDQGLVQFDSYRLVIEMSFTSEDSANNAFIQIDMANIKEPQAASLTMTAEGMAELEEVGSIAMAQIDGVSYITFPGLGCITDTAEENLMDSFGADFLDTAEFTNELDKARFVGEETLNGIEVLHYEVDSSLLDEDDELDEVSGDIYVAKEGGYLVSMVMDGTGPIDFLNEGEDSYGSMHLEYNLTDVNEVFEVTIPAECEETAVTGSEFPVMDDAYELSTFAGFTSYKVDLGLDEAVMFYETALTEEGWTKIEADSFVIGDTAVLAYTRNEETLNITMGPDDDDTLFVLIIGK